MTRTRLASALTAAVVAGGGLFPAVPAAAASAAAPAAVAPAAPAAADHDRDRDHGRAKHRRSKHDAYGRKHRPREEGMSCIYKVHRHAPVRKKPHWFSRVRGYVFHAPVHGSCRKYGHRGKWRKVVSQDTHKVGFTHVRNLRKIY